MSIMIKRRFFTAIVWLLSLHTINVQSAPLPDIKPLSHHPYWLKLGHYLPKALGGYKSTVDSNEFFNSANGKYSPQDELEATLDKLYQGSDDDITQARCRFPARYAWLESLQGKKAQFDCPEMEKWEKTLSPRGLTLVFPTAFMNNPSSMFGHTLLRIDANDQTQNKELVAFAVNFAAQPHTKDNAALYALKGLTGSYPGYFTVMPYYRKVREYNDIESRDIWEYPLNFSQEEVNRILLHLWEMKHAEFDYYFLDENCSYQLLALLQLANDKLNLVNDFPLYAIPADTVSALVEAGLTQSPKYREAFGTRLLFESKQIDDRLFHAAKQARLGNFPSATQYTDSERAAVLEFTYEWLNYDLYDLGLERNSTAKKLTRLLRERSQIDAPSPFEEVPTPSTSPDLGHRSARIGFSHLLTNHAANRTAFEWRPSYHDLYDNQNGYIPGAKISFLDTKLSLNNHGNSQLEHFYFMDAMAIAPSNRVLSSLAWNLKIGSDRPINTHSRWTIQGGAGRAWGNPDKLHSYFLFSTESSYGNMTNNRWAWGLGSSAGLLFSASANHRLGIEATWFRLLDADVTNHSSVTATWNWSLSRNIALRIESGYAQWDKEEFHSQITSYFYY